MNMSKKEMNSKELQTESIKDTLMIPEKISCETRPNSCCSDGEEFSNQEEFDRISRLLMPKVVQSDVRSKLLTQSVSWLQVNAWSNGASIEMKLTAITYFYIYLAHFEVSKARLESVLTACLMLASKIVRKPFLSFQEILKMVEKDSRVQILEEEQKIVELMEWDAWLTFDFLSNEADKICKIQEEKMNFLIEILLLKSCDPLTKYGLIQKIREASKMKILQKDYIKIDGILKKTASKKLIQFYNSKFDVNEYLKNFSS